MKLYPEDWRARVFTAVVAGVFIVATVELGPLIGIHGFWPMCAAMIVGLVLGNLGGRRLFQRSSGGPTDHGPVE